MTKPDEKAILLQRIIALQHKQSFELQELKQQFELTYDSLKPLNFVKSTIKEIITSPDIKSDIINGVIGLGKNYVSNNFLIGAKNKPVQKIIEFILKFFVKNKN